MVLAMAQPLHERQEALEEARTVLFVSIPLVLLLAWAGGYLLARRSLAPVVAMSDQAARLARRTWTRRSRCGTRATSWDGWRWLQRPAGPAEPGDRAAAPVHGRRQPRGFRTPVSILRGEAASR